MVIGTRKNLRYRLSISFREIIIKILENLLAEILDFQKVFHLRDTLHWAVGSTSFLTVSKQQIYKIN